MRTGEGSSARQIQRLSWFLTINQKDMYRGVAVLLVLCLLGAVHADDTHHYDTPVAPAEGSTEVTLFDVWPAIHSLLKTQYWYYLRGANTLYEASVDSPDKFLYFTIYRNIVGTFLVITTWTKASAKTQVNTFVRLGNGFAEGSGQKYDPVDIDPFIVTLSLGPDEYMVVVNEDGSVTVTGNLDRYNAAMGLTEEGVSEFDVVADMEEKCAIVDELNREKYWYYLDKAEKVSQNNIPTTQQYYCVFVYVNVVGTFLSISHWDLQAKQGGINTFVRLGNGKAEGANYGPVQLTPAILDLTEFKH